MPLSAEEVCAGIGATRVTRVAVDCRGQRHHVLVKEESRNPTGSVKDRTAAGLLLALDRIQPLAPGTVVIESTSGNLGLSLARLLPRFDCRLVAVIDPKTPSRTQRTLEDAGVELHHIHEPDGHGGYLLSRLRAVQELRRAHPDYRWTDQYNNRASPEAHRLTTGPEIAAQGGPELDAVYVAVSTGGTLAGISAHLRTLDPRIRVIAVDSAGSLATGCAPGRRYLAGIGSSRRSTFLRPDSYHHASHVPDAEAISMCRIALADTGLHLGGSSGSVLCAVLADLTGPYPPRRPLCLCPDGGEKYSDTVYADSWLVAHGIADDVAEATDKFRADGLSMRLE